jgi:hypothetical protein
MAPGHTPQDVRTILYPSARQGVTHAVRMLGGERSQRIALPEYVGHCVISSVGKSITPIPISAALLCPLTINQVLLYSQWGWERPQSALTEVVASFPSAGIILDRVDSSTCSMDSLPGYWQEGGAFQVFSLSKVLGLAGGLVYDRTFHVPPATSEPEEVRTVSQELLKIRNGLPVDSDTGYTLTQWEMFDLPCLSQETLSWLESNDLDAAVCGVNASRKERVEVVRHHAERLRLPEWMVRQISDEAAPSPGILPLLPLAQGSEEEVARDIFRETGLQVALYHFDFSASFVRTDWRKSIAIPLHWEVPPDMLEWAIHRVLE